VTILWWGPSVSPSVRHATVQCGGGGRLKRDHEGRIPIVVPHVKLHSRVEDVCHVLESVVPHSAKKLLHDRVVVPRVAGGLKSACSVINVHDSRSIIIFRKDASLCWREGVWFTMIDSHRCFRAIVRGGREHPVPIGSMSSKAPQGSSGLGPPDGGNEGRVG
jgi:hypothetical protein